jgi:oligopeptide transport system ATP-binding protein
MPGPSWAGFLNQAPLADWQQLLIADHPTTAFDVTVQAQILDLMRHMHGNLEARLFSSRNDIGIVSAFCDCLLIMYADRVIESGATLQLFLKLKYPYNQAGQPAVPVLHRKRRDAPHNSRAPPGLSRPIVGCPFAPRCDYPQRNCLLRRFFWKKWCLTINRPACACSSEKSNSRP